MGGGPTQAFFWNFHPKLGGRLLQFDFAQIFQIFFGWFNHQLSPNGSFMVWGPVVWIPARLPENDVSGIVTEGHPIRNLNHQPVTPWKINMEPTNHPFRKELPNLHDDVRR